jgi:hypothetical protein
VIFIGPLLLSLLTDGCPHILQKVISTSARSALLVEAQRPPSVELPYTVCDCPGRPGDAAEAVR